MYNVHAYNMLIKCLNRLYAFFQCFYVLLIITYECFLEMCKYCSAMMNSNFQKPSWLNSS